MSTANETDRAEHPGADILSGWLGYLLKHVNQRITAAGNQALQQHELRVLSFSVLWMVGENPGISPSRLAEQLRMERSNLVLLVDELEQQALVERQRSGKDRRRYALYATAPGKRLAARALRDLRQVERRAVDALDEDEYQALTALLSKVLDAENCLSD